jgi:hypothetical protein
MRIIYKHEGVTPYIPPVSHTGKSQRESVIVISSEKKTDSADNRAVSFSDEGYEVKISSEALARNGEVRTHEKAHMASLGSAAASGIIYDTRTGPGGEKIAVGGKIAVDLSVVPGDPDATLRKARNVITAANAPGNPSAGDMRTAAKAYGLAQAAQQQLNQEQINGKIDLLA